MGCYFCALYFISVLEYFVLITVYLLQALPYQISLTDAQLTSLISQEQFFSAVNVTAVWPSEIQCKVP